MKKFLNRIFLYTVYWVCVKIINWYLMKDNGRAYLLKLRVDKYCELHPPTSAQRLAATAAFTQSREISPDE